ncbi:uncharacterized protein LOC143445380 [Clavelina lepadiformis]|uniref:uncharacterized protein LOC143445380 n=1 Tax=Clavelina lepadiformis TaxID=159417 RepID=UPI004041932A
MMPFVTEPQNTPSSSKSRHSRVPSSSLLSARSLGTEDGLSESKFPRIEDCAHFHYENVYYGQIKVSFVDDSQDGIRINGSVTVEGLKPAFSVRIACKGNSWTVRRSLLHFEILDNWLHECVFVRKFSHLPVLQENVLEKETLSEIQQKLRTYLTKLSSLTDKEVGGEQIFCAPVLHWLEADNHGRNLAPHALGDVADINIPAVAAARVVRRYQAHEEDELSLEVGDMVSIIEMGVSGWWRGKQGLKVGSFPSQCVRRINSATDVIGTHERPFSPPQYSALTTKPIARKHGKFMDFLRSFLDTRPSKAHLKQKGILRERVFGCDIGELLHRTGEDIPSVVSDCTKFVEQHGVVDGIYRISGVASHIRHLRYEFDSDRRPNLEKDIVGLPKTGRVPGMSRDGNLVCDPHSVAGLCKLYFRELPNPLLTYQLYNRFASAVTDFEAEERLLRVHDVIQQLPPPHYRTLKHLIMHLRFMAQNDDHTSMHCRNLAIVWAPNLLRSRELEAGLAAFTEARVQSVVTEFLIVNGDILFSDKLQSVQYDAEHKPPRPRSLMILPSPKLISLEEAQARSKSGIVTPTAVSSGSQNTSFSAAEYPIPRLRESSNTQKGSFERRTSHYKKDTANTATHSTTSPTTVSKSRKVTNIKKQGRIVPHYIEPLSSPTEAWTEPKQQAGSSQTSHGSGWKTKLGSLLRKGAHLHGPSEKCHRHSSLRRSHSDDSLISSHGSQQKLSGSQRSLDFIRPPLTHAVSCEEPGLSDRSHPEPQVPHPRLHMADSSTVSLRRKIHDVSHRRRNSHTRHSRPAGVIYTDEDMRLCNDHMIGFKDKAMAHNKKKNPNLDPTVRCSSPFSGLSSDFPGVMGEQGLDFDPLSYKPTNKLFLPQQDGNDSGTKTDPGKSRNGEGTISDHLVQSSKYNFSSNEKKYDVSLDKNTDVMVSIKRVDSVQSLHGEPVFAAISSRQKDTKFPSQKVEKADDAWSLPTIYQESKTMSRALESMTADAVISTINCEPNKKRPCSKSAEGPCEQSKSNLDCDTKTQSTTSTHVRLKVSNSSFDELTADSIADTASSIIIPRRMTASEQLGLLNKNSKCGIVSGNKKNSELCESPMQEDEIKSITDNPATFNKQTEEKFLQLDLNENITDLCDNQHTPDTDGNKMSRKETHKISPQMSVQCYTMPQEEAMKKGSHYGSFIALVGTNVENPSEKVKASSQNSEEGCCSTVVDQAVCSQTRNQGHKVNQTVHDDSKTLHNLPSFYLTQEYDHIPASKRPYSATCVSSKVAETRSYTRPKSAQVKSVSNRSRARSNCDDEVPPSRRSYEHSHIFSPRLNTFNPEGRQREDYYFGHTPPTHSPRDKHVTSDESHTPNLFHNRSQSEDASQHYDGMDVHQNAQGNFAPEGATPCIMEKRVVIGRRLELDNHYKPSMNYPQPAPRKHYRSFSAGDSLEHSTFYIPPPEHKPVPHPRTTISSHINSLKPISHTRSYTRHSTGSTSVRLQTDPSHTSHKYVCNSATENKHSSKQDYQESYYANTHKQITTSYSNETYEDCYSAETTQASRSHDKQTEIGSKRYFQQKDLERRVTSSKSIPKPEHLDHISYFSHRRPKPAPRHYRPSHTEGQSYSNASYEAHQNIHQRDPTSSVNTSDVFGESLLHQHSHAPRNSLVQTSTALSWV